MDGPTDRRKKLLIELLSATKKLTKDVAFDSDGSGIIPDDLMVTAFEPRPKFDVERVEAA